MKAKRVFLIVWLPLFILIFAYGMYYISTQGLTTDLVEQGVVIYAVYGAGVAAIVAAIVTGIFRVATRGRGAETPSVTPPPSTS